METTVEARLAELEARVAALEGRTTPTDAGPASTTGESSAYWLVDALAPNEQLPDGSIIFGGNINVGKRTYAYNGSAPRTSSPTRIGQKTSSAYPPLPIQSAAKSCAACSPHPRQPQSLSKKTSSPLPAPPTTT